jgi:WD40 repeat protein
VFINSKGEILTGSQDGVLHLWSATGEKIKSVQAHSNIIRSIVEVPMVGIMTCSNDMKVKVWSMDLEELVTIEDHTSFVFTLAYLIPDSLDFASGGEDFKMMIYRGGKKVQEICHPNTVWAIAVDRENQNDIVTASGDG